MNAGYLQLAGPNIANLFNATQGKKIFSYLKSYKTSTKTNDKSLNNKNNKNGYRISENQQKNRNFVNRNLIFFSSAMNRHAGFFRKYNIIKQNSSEYIRKICNEIIEGKFLNKTKISIFQAFAEKTVDIIRKLNYDKLMKCFCSFDKEKYYFLKGQVNKIVNNKTNEENEKGLNCYKIK